jgi:hypothetical protein
VAKLSKWAIFLRAFLVVFLSGTASRSVTADEGERQAWAEAQRLCDPDAFFSYLSRYPSGEHVDQALIALSELGALQVAEGELFSSFCQNPVRQLPVIPAPVPVQAQSGPSGGSDDPY